LTSASFESCNPATLAPLGSVSVTAPESVDEILSQIAAVAPLWSQLRVADRARYIERAAQAAIDELDALCDLLVAEAGRPRTEILAGELLAAIEQLRWLAANARGLLSARRVPIVRTLQPLKRASAGWAPCGLVAVVGAGSAPFAKPLVEIAAALLAGNGVLFKPAPRAALAAERIAGLFARAGLPEGLLRVIHGGRELGLAVAGANAVAHVFFTGGVAAGGSVAGAAARHGATLSSDVARSEAMIVLADARAASAAAGALWGSSQAAGQGHGAVRCVYIEQQLHDDFLDQLTRLASELVAGDPLDPATQLGPLANTGRRDRLVGLVSAFEAAGGRRLHGEPLMPTGLAGAFHSATVLSGTRDQLSALRVEHVAGPLVAVAAVPGSLEAVAAVNSGTPGAGVSIWSSDRRRAARIARELRCEAVWCNDHLPGSGFVHSAGEAVRATVRPKLITWDPPAPPPPWRFPYNATSGAALHALAVLHSNRDGDRERALRSGGHAITRVAGRALRNAARR
jgi:acyl-CoA reductase-like NAD-dependent aldehyde dehydrogenase